jgi:hypothetical protein
MGRFTSTKPVAALQAIGTASLLATFPAVRALGRYDSVYNERNDNPGFVAPDRFTATTMRLRGRDVQLSSAPPKRLDRSGRSAPKPRPASTRGRSASPRREHDLAALSRLVEQSRDRLFSAQGLAHDPLRTDMPLRGRFNPHDALPRVDP